MARTRLAIRLDPVRTTGLTRDTPPGWPAISMAGNFRVTQRRGTYHRTTSGSRSAIHDAGLGPPSLIRTDSGWLRVTPRAAGAGIQIAGSRSFLQLRCVTTAKWSDRWPGQLHWLTAAQKLIPADALLGGAYRARLDGGLAVDLLAPRRCGAGGYGLRGEVVTEHGDPPVADAEDLHQ